MKMKRKTVGKMLSVVLAVGMLAIMASPVTKSAKAAGKAPAKTKITALRSTKAHQLTISYKKVAKPIKLRIVRSKHMMFSTMVHHESRILV
ncbi:MAG: hypothetical protein MR316_05570 [Lachnospiraceae bacterium]|nr:hypothetical protein [Lachnospiraceae bacterium]